MGTLTGEVLDAATHNVELFIRLESAFYQMAPGAHLFPCVANRELCSAKKYGNKLKNVGKFGEIG